MSGLHRFPTGSLMYSAIDELPYPSKGRQRETRTQRFRQPLWLMAVKLWAILMAVTVKVMLPLACLLGVLQRLTT